MGCKVIGVMSFKGGVGKTVSTINLGAALQSFGKNVLIIDGNFLSPSLHFYLGLLNPEKTLKEVVREGIGVENAIYEHKSGLHLMPCNFYKNINLEKFREVICDLKKKYDYIILDSGPSYTEEIIAILMVSDELIFIATPDYPTLAATVKATKVAKYKDIKILGIVINRRRNKGFELKTRDIEKTTTLPVIAEIPEDNKMMCAILNFMPVVWKYKRSKSSRAYLKLAKELELV